jgi:hypothetical protein
MIRRALIRAHREMLKPKAAPVLGNRRDRRSAGDSCFDTASAALWSMFGYYLWRGRMVAAGGALVALSIILAFFSRSLVEAKIAETKSYRDFMIEVNRLVQPAERLVLYGGFNGDAVAFYRGGTVEVIDRFADDASARIADGDGYIITSEKNWNRLQQAQPKLAAPLLRSRGKGPEGDAPLLLLRGVLQ